MKKSPAILSIVAGYKLKKPPHNGAARNPVKEG
nr:MAG TPA: hypothetical protein [Caudoviricetes sp.]